MRVFKTSISKFILTLVTFVIASCSQNDIEKKNNDITLKSYRLIDEHRTNEAIELLETEIAKTPENYEYKTLLASAYAHKGGIVIHKLVPVVNKAEKIKELDIKFLEIRKSHSNNEKVNYSVINTSKLLSQFSLFFDSYSVVPVIDPSRVAYIRHAMYILDDLGNMLKPEDALYRAVLGVVLFKHILAEKLLGEFIGPSSEDSECRLALGTVNDAIVELGEVLIGVLVDLGYVNPKIASDMRDMSDRVAQAVSNLTLATTSLIVLDEASNIFLKEALLQNGFGKLVKCGGDKVN